MVVSLRIRPGRRNCCSFTLSLVDVVVWCRAAPAACERQAANRHAQGTSGGTPYLPASCQLPATCRHTVHAHRAAPQRDAPGQSKSLGFRLSNGECYWSHAGRAQTTKGTRRRGDLVEQFFNLGHALGVSARGFSSSRRAFCSRCSVSRSASSSLTSSPDLAPIFAFAFHIGKQKPQGSAVGQLATRSSMPVHCASILKQRGSEVSKYVGSWALGAQF